MEEANNSFNEGARDQDKLSLGVIRTPEDDNTIVDRSFLTDLGETLEMATQWR